MSPAIPKSWPSLYHRRRGAPSGDDGPAVWSLVRAQLVLAHKLRGPAQRRLRVQRVVRARRPSRTSARTSSLYVTRKKHLAVDLEERIPWVMLQRGEHSPAFRTGGTLSPADQEFGGVGQGRLVDPPREHPGELSAALFALDDLYAGDRPSFRLSFLDDDVSAGPRGYLRKMGDGQNLVAIAEFPQLRPYRRRRLAAYTGVDLVEDVRRTGLYALLGEPYGQHYPGELPARCVAPHGQFGLTWVGLNHELHPLCARWTRFCGHE